MSEKKTKRPNEPRNSKTRWLRRVATTAAVGTLAAAGLWIAVHRVPWLGPMVADGLRAVVGVENVTGLQDFVYGVQDRVRRASSDEQARPKAYWKVPASQLNEPLTPTEVGTCTVDPFSPKRVGPVHDTWSAPGDGEWVPIVDPRHVEDAPRLYKTLLHPDKQRSWAAVSIVAVDLRQVDLHAMAGRAEPVAETKQARGYSRPAVIPPEHTGALIAAFNGGFKTQHGHYGMKIDGITIVPPRIRSCWIAMFPSGELAIGDWEKLKEREPEASWWRQTPNCMVDGGELHPGLRHAGNTAWGATLSGDTVIRRSALGLSTDGKTLFSGIGDHTTARAIALAMKHAGAANVAQLDVNWSYPKFVLYEPRAAAKDASANGVVAKDAAAKDDLLVATKLCDGFAFSEGQYIRDVAPRDFFYLTRKPNSRIQKDICGDPSEARNDRDSGVPATRL